jgi:ferric-dicitrate binding protein FerR (iron transport regulator)
MKTDKNITDEIIYRILNKEASEQEEEIFRQWLALSKQNQKSFLQLEQLWQNTGGVADYYRINQEQSWEAVSRKIRKRPEQKIRYPLLKIAAAIATAYLLGIFTMYLMRQGSQQPVETIAENHVKVPLGSKTEIQLSDGTMVWLNSGSEVSYPPVFEPELREMTLSGEAFFDVQKNNRVPFVVHTGDLDVRVMGTSFNVKSYPGEDLTETTLVEGLVELSNRDSKETVVLRPGERAVMIKSRKQFDRRGLVETDLYTSWKNGKLVFKRERFGDLAVKMERWYNIRISISNKRLSDERVTGIFEKESVEQALRALQISVPFQYEIRKNNIMIY